MERVKKIYEHPSYKYALQEIERLEETRIYCRHGWQHLLDTARIAWIMVLEEHLAYEKDVVYAAGLLHDIGKYLQYKEGTPHHEASQSVAEHILVDAGYTEAECKCIVDAIGKHRQYVDSEQMSLNQILYKADKQSRHCFLCEAKDTCHWSEEKKNKLVVY